MLLSINKTLQQNMPSNVTSPKNTVELHITELGNMYISRNDGTFQQIQTNASSLNATTLFEGNMNTDTSSAYSLEQDFNDFNFLIIYIYNQEDNSIINKQIIIPKTLYSSFSNNENFHFSEIKNLLDKPTTEMYISIVGLN